MRIVSLIECSLPPLCHTMRAKYRHALRRHRASSYNFAASVKINDFTVNMGHYKLQRPSWNPRGQEIKYVVKERILTRGWPKTYNDAKTLKQQRQRGRVEQLNLFLPKLKSLLALGYSRGNKPNGRAVGSYQMAFSQALHDCFPRDGMGNSIQMENLRLTDGNANLPTGLLIKSNNGIIVISWERIVVQINRIILFAARNTKSKAWFTQSVHVESNCNSAAIRMPESWLSQNIECWTAFLPEGSRLKTATQYVRLTC